MIEENFYGKELVLSILQKQPNAITQEEREILMARSHYLTEDEKKRYLSEEPTSKKKKKNEE